MLRTFALAVLLIVTALPVTAGFKEGVAAYDRGDYKTALREFQPLAEQGHAKAQFNLGLKYYKGLSVPMNYALAVNWLQKAAAPGVAAGQALPPGEGRENLGPRELPTGASEAEVRRHCTRQYDVEASMFADPTASGWGGISDAQLLQEFRRCMLRHGVRP